MTRRQALSMISASLPLHAAGVEVRVPVRRIVDARAQCTPEQLHRFWWTLWPEAVRDFRRCGVNITATDGAGEIRRSPGSRPLFTGLEHGVVNMVVTRQIPLDWARGRGIAGVSAIWDGYHLCVIALDHAHAHRVPVIAVNTCVHELLHVLLEDVFVRRSTWTRDQQHELRVNWLATRLWLFNDGAAIRQSAASYLARLRPPPKT